MSGICAVVYKDSRREATLESIADMIQCLGPHDAPKHLSKRLGPVAVGAYEPLRGDLETLVYSDANVVIACDAEIYNGKELAREVGMPLPENGDFPGEAPLIAHLYQKYGDGWFAKVIGPCSAILYDRNSGHTYAYTDRLGVKPIVYWQNSEKIVFATRNKSLLAAGAPKDFNRQALYLYLHLEVIPSPHTVYQNMRRLESGFRVHWNGSESREERTWKMTYPAEKLSLPDILEQTYSKTRKAVQRQLAYRAPISETGAFLSGGTDSSTLTGLIHEINPGKARTFSIGFDESGYDEMQFARIAAKAYQTDHTEYYVTAEDVLNALPKIIQAYDEPFANSSAIPTYFCSKIAKEKGIGAMIGGDGGDEIFGGNSRYHETFSHFNRFPQWVVDGVFAPALALTPRALHKGPLQKIENYVNRSRAPLHEKIHAFGLKYYLDESKVFDKSFLANGNIQGPPEFTKRYLEEAGTPSQLDQFMYFDLKLTLMDNDLRKVGRMTELAGVKPRYPFLDVELVEFTGQIPPDLKVNNGQLRYTFKQAFSKLLPQEIIQKTKHGFGLPIVRWMLRPGKLNDLLKEVIFDSSANHLRLFRPGFVEELYAMSLKDRTPYFGTYLYYILALELWMKSQR